VPVGDLQYRRRRNARRHLLRHGERLSWQGRVHLHSGVTRDATGPPRRRASQVHLVEIHRVDR
jgi:hypothetical protein